MSKLIERTGLAHFIDHTLLKPDSTQEQIAQLCTEARNYEFASVCINSCWVAFAKKQLKGSAVKVCTVVGFPLGACLTAAKVAETKAAIKDGAHEIDMVINIGALKSKMNALVKKDIAAVVKTARGKTVKVIIETALLTDEEKIRACKISKSAGAHFVKTCTGFSGGGASVDDVELMKKIVGKKIQVKASGGIKDVRFAYALIEAGATRLGTSSGVALMNDSLATGGY
jgi:deoxyribose-phosphate aldolase